MVARQSQPKVKTLSTGGSRTPRCQRRRAPHWEEAEFRARVLAELPAQLTQGNVDWAIRQLNVSRSTLFRLVKQFREDGRTSALLPDTRGPKPGMQPLDPAVEAIVSRHFKEFYATRRKPTRTRFWREIAADCQAQGLAPPSIRRLGRWPGPPPAGALPGARREPATGSE